MVDAITASAWLRAEPVREELEVRKAAANKHFSMSLGNRAIVH